MNYNNYGYPGNYQAMQMQQQMQNTQQMQNGGFINAPNIESARSYPVAPGSVVTFKIENQPIVCEKSQGFSQFESPHFAIYDLKRREENIQEDIKNNKDDIFVNKDYINPIINSIQDDIEMLKTSVSLLQERNKKQSYISKNNREVKEDDTK
jgi:hypothetical protein